MIVSPVIGVFDSGVGGLTVARAVLAQLPQARLLYFGDTAHVPYGPRPLAQVRDFALQIISFLFERGADAVVMGCNMSSAAGAHAVAVQRFSKPVFEVIGPGSRAACEASQCGKIGVIATQGTVNSGAYGHALLTHGATAVLEQPCPAFVPLVERGLTEGPEVDAAVAEYLTPVQAAGVDTVVFGCTHYPFLRDPIARYLGEGVTLIDPADHAAAEVAALFGPPSDRCMSNDCHRFYCSGDPNSLRREGERFLGIPLAYVEQVNVPVE